MREADSPSNVFSPIAACTRSFMEKTAITDRMIKANVLPLVIDPVIKEQKVAINKYNGA